MAKELALAFTIKGILDATFKNSTNATKQAMSDISSETKKLKRSMDDINRAQKLLNQSYKAGGMSLSTYFNRQQELKKSMKEKASLLGQNAMDLAGQSYGSGSSGASSGDNESGVSKILSAVPKGAVVASGIISGLKEAIDTAIKFESAMADVKKVVNFDTPAQFKEMQNDIMNLTKILPMTGTEIAKIVAAGGQAGIAKNDLIGFAEAAAKMGIAFDISADQAGDMMAKWRTAFKMSQPEVVALADKINYLSNNVAATAPQISDVVTRIGPLGAVGGLASGEIAAMGASMVAAGTESDVAATGVKNFILSMVSGESATKSQAEAFESLGMSATDVAKRMQTDARGAIMDVLKAIQGLDADRQASTLQELFGKESIGAIAPLLTNLDALDKSFQMVGASGEYAGSMDAEFQARCETTENSIKLLENAISRVANTVGSVFLPYIKDAAKALADGVDGAMAFASEHDNLVSVLGATAAAAGAAIAAYKAYAILQTVVAWLKEATIAQRALNLAMSMNPIGLVIAALAALAAFLIYLWNTNESFRNAVTGAWEAICNTAEWAFNTAKDAISGAMDAIWEKIDTVVGWVKEKWQSLREFLSHPISGTIEIAKNTIGGVAGSIMGNAEGGIYNKGAFLTTFAEEAPEAAIPLDGSQRAIGLWQRAGELLGVANTGNRSLNGSSAQAESGGVKIEIKNSITINGNADNDSINNMKQSIEDAVASALERIQNQRERVSYV